MFGGGKGMGGGGGRAMRVLSKSIARAGVTNLQETLSSSSSATGAATSPTAISRSTHKLNSSSNVLSLSSASGYPFNSCNIPVPANCGGSNTTPWPYFPSAPCDSSCDDYEWVSVGGSEGERAASVSDDFVLGAVPSLDEVHGAVSALTQVFDTPSYSQFITDKFAYNADKDVADQISSPTGIPHCVSAVGSDSDWVEPSPHLCNSRTLQPYGPNAVYDAFHLLQNEPSIQRMVISLSSDKAVWNAVLNNEVVRELHESYSAGESIASPTSESSVEASEHSNPAMSVVWWMFHNTMAKFMEVIEKITRLVSELFKAPDVEKKTNGTMFLFEEKLRTSFLLSVVVLLVVIVNRAHRA